MKHNQRKIGAALSYVSIFVSTIVQLLYTPFLISKLGQSEYGLYSLVSSIIGYLTVLDLGFGNAIVVHTTKYRALGESQKEKTLHGMFRIIYTIIGVIAGILGLILAFNTNNIFGATMTLDELNKMRIMLSILSFNIFATFAFSIYSSIITASEEFVFQKILSIINTIAKPVLMTPLLFMGFKSITLCLVITIINIAILISNYLFCRQKLNIKIKFQGLDKKMLKKISFYSFWIFLAQVVDKINWGADQFILGAVSGPVAVSIYSAAAILNTMTIDLSTAISGIMLPKMARMIAKNATPKELSDEFIKIGRIQFYIIFLVVSGLVLVGKDFINVWLGEGFEQSYIIALLLIIPMIPPLIQNTGLAIMQAMNKFKFRALSTFAMSLINIVISIFLAKQFGAPGAAFGTCISLLLCNCLAMNIYYKKVIKLDILKFWKNILSIAIKLFIPIIVTAIIIIATNLDGLMAFLMYGSIYVVLYAATMYFIAANNYEKEYILNTISKIMGNKK